MTDDPVFPVPPVPLVLIGTGPGTEGAAPLPPGTIVWTANHQPNLVIQVITPIRALLVRFINVYVGMVVGLLGTAMTSNAIPAPDFWHLVLKCAGLAVGGAVVLMLKDVVTLFGRLEQKYPLLTGSV